jgi:Zn-dependent peptidase ImmA (M78 family)/DNA-binding XRE family transcriptional regulator
MINGFRIKQARELCGWTQTDLARDLGIRQASLAQLEIGQFQPSDKLLEALILKTGFPQSFFEQESADDFPFGSLVFRARASMTNRQRMEAYRYAQTLYGLAATLAARVSTIQVRLPRLSEPPSTAARLTRAALGLAPDTPIPRLLHALEKNGVWVVRLPITLDARDAFCQWTGPDRNRPIIFLSYEAPGDRLRWSAGHELGHLVRDQAMRGQVTDIEREADQFAAEFLMPEIAMRQEITIPVSLNTVASLKRRWGVSLQGLIRRTLDLEIITRRQYKRLFEQIGARGWRVKEPEHLDVPAEHPRSLRKMAEVAYGDPINYQRLAKDARLPVEFVREAIAAQAERPQVKPEERRTGKVVPIRRP